MVTSYLIIVSMTECLHYSSKTVNFSWLVYKSWNNFFYLYLHSYFETSLITLKKSQWSNQVVTDFLKDISYLDWWHGFMLKNSLKGWLWLHQKKNLIAKCETFLGVETLRGFLHLKQNQHFSKVTIKIEFAVPSLLSFSWMPKFSINDLKIQKNGNCFYNSINQPSV